MDALRQIKNWLAGRSAPKWEALASDGAGFTLGVRRVEWSQINSVAAFKRDMVTVDDIWFQLETEQGRIMICEEQPGFDRWEFLLCSALPAVSTWRSSVLQPPFAENFSILYRRT